MTNESPELPSLGLLTFDDVAEHLRCSKKSVQRLITSGDLPVVRIGRMVRIHPTDLGRFIKLRRSV